MSRLVVLRAKAVADLDGIEEYIGKVRNAPEAAERVTREMRHLFELLSENPGIGRVVFAEEDLSDIRRAISPRFPNYAVYYLTSKAEVDIVRILHTSQNVEHHKNLLQ